MRINSVFVAISILLLGFASYRYHPVKEQAVFEQDHTNCEYDVLIERHGASVYNLEIHQLVERCLEIKGWVGPYTDNQPGKNMSVESFN